MLEKDVEKKIKKWVVDRGWKYYKLGGTHNRGKPDNIIIGPSSFVFFLEVKAPGKKPTKLQLSELWELSAFGHYCGCADSCEAAVDLIVGAHQNFLSRLAQ